MIGKKDNGHFVLSHNEDDIYINGSNLLDARNNDIVLIQVDSDVDGYTSAAKLANYLYNLFPAFVVNNIIFRFHDGKEHGIDIKLVSEEDLKIKYITVHKSKGLEEDNVILNPVMQVPAGFGRSWPSILWSGI